MVHRHPDGLTWNCTDAVADAAVYVEMNPDGNVG
jgi:hypothetical protein